MSKKSCTLVEVACLEKGKIMNVKLNCACVLLLATDIVILEIVVLRKQQYGKFYYLLFMC